MQDSRSLYSALYFSAAPAILVSAHRLGQGVCCSVLWNPHSCSVPLDMSLGSVRGAVLWLIRFYLSQFFGMFYDQYLKSHF